MTVRVLWVIKGLGPGGAERLLVAAAGVHRADNVTLECAYVLPWKDHLADDLARAGVHLTCLSNRRRDLRWPVRLARMVRSGDFDVVHVHSPLPGSVARLAVRSMRRGARPAVVATEHNRWRTHRLPTRWLNRVTSRWNDVTLAVTDEVRDTMTGRAGKQATTLQHGRKGAVEIKGVGILTHGNIGRVCSPEWGVNVHRNFTDAIRARVVGRHFNRYRIARKRGGVQHDGEQCATGRIELYVGTPWIERG